MRIGKYGKYIKHKENPTSFAKGMTPWNKGLKGYQAGDKHYGFGESRSAEVREKISAAKQGITREEWKDYKNTENRRERLKFQKTIQKLVFKRDNYTCQMCGIRGGILHVDHIQPFAEYVQGRFNMENCRTLCRSCHYLVTFGKIMPQDSEWGKSFLSLNENLFIRGERG